MNDNININDSHLNPSMTFRRLCFLHMQQLTNFPYIEKDFDALTDYELLCLVVKYLNDVINNSNKQNESITNLYNAFLELQTYMNNSVQELEDAFNELNDYVRDYFANLDVQEEINNKLDEMLEDGVLEQIIEQFINSTALWVYDTVANMKSATNLINGSFAKTLGYYSVNDGGGAIYKITDTESETDYQEELETGLYATLIIKDYVTPEMFGCYGDNTHNDSTSMQNCFNHSSSIMFGNNKTYLFETPIVGTKTSYNLKGNNSKFYANFANESAIITIDNSINGKVEGIEFEGGLNTAGIHTGNSSKMELTNCRFLNLGLYGCSEFKYVNNSYFYNCARKTGDENGQGMIYAGKDNVIYENNEFYALDGDGLDHCIYAGGSQHKNIQILNNKCFALEGCTQGPLLALYPSVQGENPHENCIVKGNIFDYKNGASSRSAVVLTINHSIFNDNICYGDGTSKPSIWLDNVNNSEISNNNFNDGYVRVTRAINTKFSNNIMKDIVNLWLVGDTNSLDGFEISNNKFINCGIEQRNYANNISIIGNTFENITGSAINMNKSDYPSSNVKIINNTITNASGYAILCRYIEKIMIVGNVIRVTNSSLTTSRGISLQHDTNYSGSIIANNIVDGTILDAYQSSIYAERSGGIYQNNYGGNFGNGMLTDYPENGSAAISNHTPYYVGELLNLNGVIYVAKGVSGPSDWVQIS